MKTKKGVKKRFRVTKNGKVIRTKANRGHLMSGKSGKRRRRLRKAGVCFATDAKRVRECLGK